MASERRGGSRLLPVLAVAGAHTHGGPARGRPRSPLSSDHGARGDGDTACPAHFLHSTDRIGRCQPERDAAGKTNNPTACVHAGHTADQCFVASTAPILLYILRGTVSFNFYFSSFDILRGSIRQPMSGARVQDYITSSFI
jgi:hypothetical protein